MKRHALLLIIMAVIAITASAQTDIVSAAQFNRYAEANATVPPRAKDEKRVVFIGNSITELWQITRPEFFSSDNYIGRGISGQTSYSLLLRFRQDVLNLDPTVVVIEIGTNDIATNTGAYDEDYTFANIVTMVELAQLHNIKVVLATIPPAVSYPWQPSVTGVPDKIESLNHRLHAYANAHRIPFADYYTPLVHPGDRAFPVTFSDDGVHPNAAGYAIMESVIRAILKKL